MQYSVILFSQIHVNAALANSLFHPLLSFDLFESRLLQTLSCLSSLPFPLTLSLSPSPSLCPSLCLSLYLSVSLCDFLPLLVSFRSSLSLSVSVSLPLSLSLSFSSFCLFLSSCPFLSSLLSVFLSSFLSFFLSVFLSFALSVSVSVSLSLFPFPLCMRDLACAICYCVFCARYVVASLDVTVYPANADLMKTAFAVLSAVAAMSSAHCGWVMLPVYQDQTNETAVMRHRRAIEDGLIKLGLNLKNEIAILFKKAEGARDGRPMSQMARVAITKQFLSTSPWLSSDAVQDGRAGPCELIKISDFIGFDQEAQRPGAAARVEQNLANAFSCFVQILDSGCWFCFAHVILRLFKRGWARPAHV